MSDQRDDELDALLNELAPNAEDRAALLEEHRLLEKDLARLADPLPPSDFVAKVMAKVEAAPAPAPSRAEIISAGFIVFGALSLALAAFVSTGSASTGPGLALTQFVLAVREAVVVMGSALAALWRTAAVPMVAALGMTLGLSLFGLRRLTQVAGSKVTP